MHLSVWNTLEFCAPSQSQVGCCGLGGSLTCYVWDVASRGWLRVVVSLNADFLWDSELWTRGRFCCQESEGQKETNTFLTSHVKAAHPCVIAFSTLHQRWKLKVSVKQGDSAFSGTRVVLIKSGFYFGMFCFAFDLKRSEGDREKSRAVGHLLNGKKINYFAMRKKKTALQIYKMFIIYGLWIWTIISLISKGEIWQFQPWIQGPVDKLKIILKFNIKIDNCSVGNRFFWTYTLFLQCWANAKR